MKWVLIFILLVFSWSSIFGFLKTEGTKIVDENGDEIILKGFGLGGWLQPEGYMWQIEQNGNWPLSPTEIESAVYDLIGRKKGKDFFALYEKSHINELDIRQIAFWGANCVRLPINAKRLQPREGQVDGIPYLYNEKGFEIIDSCLKWCKKNGVYVILDLHCVPGGQTDDHIADPVTRGEAGLWKYPERYWPMTIDLWGKIASRYRDEKIIAGYDILNEPGFDHDEQDGLRDSLRSLSEKITDEIRRFDENHIVFIEGLRWSTDFTGMTPPWDSNMVYTFHKYWDDNDDESIRDFLELRERYQVPIFNGETGENDAHWARSMADLHEKHKIGWCWWTVKKVDDWETQPFSVPSPEGYDEILRYWTSRGKKPSREEAEKTLFQFAHNFHIMWGNCQLVENNLTALGFNPNQSVKVYEKTERNSFESIRIYPNPLKNRILNIQFPNEDFSRDEEITFLVYNLLGEVVYENQFIGKSRLIIPIQKELPSGVYLYGVIAGNSKLKKGKFTVIN